MRCGKLQQARLRLTMRMQLVFADYVDCVAGDAQRRRHYVQVHLFANVYAMCTAYVVCTYVHTIFANVVAKWQSSTYGAKIFIDHQIGRGLLTLALPTRPVHRPLPAVRRFRV
jgi:hypothetical protein